MIPPAPFCRPPKSRPSMCWLLSVLSQACPKVTCDLLQAQRMLGPTLCCLASPWPVPCPAAGMAPSHQQGWLLPLPVQADASSPGTSVPCRLPGSRQRAARIRCSTAPEALCNLLPYLCCAGCPGAGRAQGRFTERAGAAAGESASSSAEAGAAAGSADWPQQRHT